MKVFRIPLIAGMSLFSTLLLAQGAGAQSGQPPRSMERQLSRNASEDVYSRKDTKVARDHEEKVLTHHVPFGSSGNRIDLTLVTGSVPIGHVNVRCVNPPDWIHMPTTQQVSDVRQNNEQTLTFTFSIEKAAPVNTEQDLEFLIYADGSEMHKIIRIVVDLPNKFELFQNYPNPFNPVTVVSYTVPEKRYITVKVYDVLGREVRTLADELQEAGYKTVNFDASDLASGVYFYRMLARPLSGGVAGEFVAVRKLVVMK